MKYVCARKARLNEEQARTRAENSLDNLGIQLFYYKCKKGNHYHLTRDIQPLLGKPLWKPTPRDSK